jgi:lysine N6-hydroxylase
MQAADVADYEAIAIGAGPANLSLGALACGIKGIKLLVLEGRQSFSWHPGIRPPSADLQVSPLKDLVTLIDPTNYYSFLNYLATHKRLYRALIAHRYRVSRAEFDAYYAWVSQELPSVQFGEEVLDVDYDQRLFLVRTTARTYRARHLISGVGRTPLVPDGIVVDPPAGIIHSSCYADIESCAGRRILIVGAGQSGAEVFEDIISGSKGPPIQVTWVNSRSGLRPLDDSPFVNECYAPRYIESFHRLGGEARSRLLNDEILSSDGVSPALLESIYKRLYVNDYLDKDPIRYSIYSATRLESLRSSSDGLIADLRNTLDDTSVSETFDQVVLATGYRFEMPKCLSRLASKIEMASEEPMLNADFSANLIGAPAGSLFFQNASRAHHGLADSNLSIMPWRSATIINSITGESTFCTEAGDITMDLGFGKG